MAVPSLKLRTNKITTPKTERKFDVCSMLQNSKSARRSPEKCQKPWVGGPGANRFIPRPGTPQLDRAHACACCYASYHPLQVGGALRMAAAAEKNNGYLRNACNARDGSSLSSFYISTPPTSPSLPLFPGGHVGGIDPKHRLPIISLGLPGFP